MESPGKSTRHSTEFSPKRAQFTSEVSSLEVIGAEVAEDPGTEIYPPTSGSKSSSSCSSAVAWGPVNPPRWNMGRGTDQEFVQGGKFVL